DTWAKDKESREKRFEQVRKHVASRASIGPDDQTRGAYPPRWYVNSQTQTMVVIPGPVEFRAGSQPKAAGREPAEIQVNRRIVRTFAIAAKPVTVEQYCRFDEYHQLLQSSADAMDPPAQADNADDLDRWSAFHETVAALPAAEKEVVGLVFYHGWKQKEVASFLRVSERQVRRYWVSACCRLKEMLAEVPRG